MPVKSKSIRGDRMKPTAKDVLVDFVLDAATESRLTHDQLKAILKEIDEQYFNLTVKGKI